MGSIDRVAAKQQGLKTYFTGKPCKHGHIDSRLVSNSTCSACNRLKVLAWQVKNPEKADARNKRWQAKHPGKAAQRTRVWYAANLERHKATRRAYFDANPHLRAALSSRARAKLLQRTPNWLTDDDFWLIDQFYELAALRTQVTGFAWHVDHVVPLRGKQVSGLHTPDNLRVVPAQINLQKGNRYAVG